MFDIRCTYEKTIVDLIIIIHTKIVSNISKLTQPSYTILNSEKNQSLLHMVVNSKNIFKRTCLVGSCLFKLVSFVLEPEISTDLTQPMYEFAKK